MTSKREAEQARDARREEEWKETLSMIRGQVPQLRHRGGDETLLTLELCRLQNWACFWCGERMTNEDSEARSYRTLEHVIPRSSGRKEATQRGNLRAACRECNETRGAFNDVLERLKRIRRIEEQLTNCQRTLARHRVTMAGRCWFCWFRFHFKEWLYRRKEAKKV